MMKTLAPLKKAIGAALTGIMCTTSVYAATTGSHYPLGAEGVKAASAPPPGFHYRMYNSWYESTSLKDDQGKNKPVGFEFDLYAQVHRIVQITDKTILGANYGYNVLIPLTDQSTSITAAGISDSEGLSFGDLVIEPLTLVWYREQFEAVFGLAIIAPTGDFDADRLTNPGMGYWSGLVTAGGTYYLDSARSWSVSALTRTLFHSQQDTTDITPGSEFVVEGGVGKEFLYNQEWMIRPGINYAGYWQISDDSQDGPTSLAEERKRSFCLGAEINVFYLPLKFQANLRYSHEFEARNTAEGSSLVLTLTKSF